MIGVPDDRMGEAVCAWIRPREGVTNITPEAIKEYCKGKVFFFSLIISETEVLSELQYQNVDKCVCKYVIFYGNISEAHL